MSTLMPTRLANRYTRIDRIDRYHPHNVSNLDVQYYVFLASTHLILKLFFLISGLYHVFYVFYVFNDLTS